MKTIKPFKNRNELLENWALTQPRQACEVGVQAGEYSKKILTTMSSLSKFYAIDGWVTQKNYSDPANTTKEQFTRYFEMTKTNLAPWEEKVEILRGDSLDMVHKISDSSLDFIYIDARHDYVGCTQDLEAYWSKLKKGGLFSGHDYIKAPYTLGHFGDWTLCVDGTRNPRAVKGAVNDFAETHGLQVVVSYDDRHTDNTMFHSWAIVKQ